MSGADTRLPEVFELGGARRTGGLGEIVPELMVRDLPSLRRGEPGDATLAAERYDGGRPRHRSTEFPAQRGRRVSRPGGSTPGRRRRRVGGIARALRRRSSPSCARCSSSTTCRWSPPPERAQPAPVGSGQGESSMAREDDSSRYASICAWRSATFCSAVAMASAPAMKRRGGGSALAMVISACASFAGSPPCWPFWDFQNACCAACAPRSPRWTARRSSSTPP